MDQTPIHEAHNQDLLKLIPETSANLIEVGCSSGALAREFKKINPSCHYLGIDIDENYVNLAARYCDATLAMNIDNANESFFKEQHGRLLDLWRYLGTPSGPMGCFRQNKGKSFPTMARSWHVSLTHNIGQDI